MKYEEWQPHDCALRKVEQPSASDSRGSFFKLRQHCSLGSKVFPNGLNGVGHQFPYGIPLYLRDFCQAIVYRRTSLHKADDFGSLVERSRKAT